MPATAETSLSPNDLKQLGLGLDNHADVFRHEDKILRALYREHEQFYTDLADHAVVKQLVADGLLIGVAKSSLRVDGYNVVLEHPVIPYVTFPYEWTPSAFKDAAKAILQINIRLMEHGYCTQDGYPWNILFDGSTPKFIDFTSIVKLPADGKWLGIDDFNNCCINALKLMEKGYPTVARALLREVKSFPDQALANAVFFNTKRYANYPKLVGDLRKMQDTVSYFVSKGVNRLTHRSRMGAKGSLQHLKALLEDIEKMNVEPTKEMWSRYYVGGPDYPLYTGKREELERFKTATPKHVIIETLLERIQPKSVLDIACNRGVYSQLAALRGARVIGVDNDELALDEMYHDTKGLKTNVIPLYVNVVTPAEPVTFKDRPFPTTEERLRSDATLCLALMHHLAFKPPFLSFAHMVNILASFTEKWLIVEWVPASDKYVQEHFQKRGPGFADRFKWYTYENFRAALEKQFSSIEAFDSHPAPRKMLLCRKKAE